MDVTEVRPFSVEISRAAIDDLRERLARTRWPEKEPVGDWSMGIPLAYVQELASYWAESYDMRRVADLLNRYEQFTTAIDGVDIHFLHVRAPVEGATPCIMTHGCPGSVIEFVKVIDPLVDPVAPRVRVERQADRDRLDLREDRAGVDRADGPARL